jgi:hypothetical protein
MGTDERGTEEGRCREARCAGCRLEGKVCVDAKLVSVGARAILDLAVGHRAEGESEVQLRSLDSPPQPRLPNSKFIVAVDNAKSIEGPRYPKPPPRLTSSDSPPTPSNTPQTLPAPRPLRLCDRAPTDTHFQPPLSLLFSIYIPFPLCSPDGDDGHSSPRDQDRVGIFTATNGSNI